jgi:phosphoribosylformylglycinamidine (FGAM) synthase-like enzyme
VAEAARNVAVSGAQPIGATDCLNFGSPQDPEVMWQFAQAVKGMADACRALEIPVISGNVSLYNQSPKRAIDPTPIVGVVGLIEPAAKGELRTASSWFKKAGDWIYVAGESKDELGGSEYLSRLFSSKAGVPPQIDLKSEKKLQRFAVEAVHQGLVASAHDCSDGGMAVALAESCMGGQASQPQLGSLGAEVGLEAKIRPDALLFGETQSRALYSCDPAKAKALEALARKHGLPFKKIGTVGGKSLKCQVSALGGNFEFETPVSELLSATRSTFKIMG